jgi:hypothetical protein
VSILNAQTLSEAIRSLPGHGLREVCNTPCGVVLTGTIFADTGLSGQDAGALVTVSIANHTRVEICHLQKLHPFPLVVCHEPWIIRDKDWHAFPDGGLCWELYMKWQDQLNFVIRLNPNAKSEFAASYFLSSTAWLIGRHRLQYLFNIPKWRNDWPQWGHDAIGPAQYLHERKRKK